MGPPPYVGLHHIEISFQAHAHVPVYICTIGTYGSLDLTELTAVWLVCVVRVSVSCHQVGAGRGSSLGAGAVDHSGFSESLSYTTLYIANAIFQSASMLLI